VSHVWSIRARSLTLLAVVLFVAGCTSTSQPRVAEPIKVKIFVAAMFEIGQNTGDRAGEFQFWYERYWNGAPPIAVPGAL
jgi:hypothetical protein